MKRGILLPLLLTLLAVALIPLLWLNQTWLREDVLEPLLFALWSIRLMLLSIPQAVYWGLILFAVMVILALSLRPEFSERATLAREVPQTNLSRYRQWLALTANLSLSKYAADTYSRDLTRLAVQIFSYQEDRPGEEIYALINEGRLGIPDELQLFLQNRAFANQPSPLSPFRTWINRLIGKKPELTRPLTPLDDEAGRILAHIENLLNPQESENNHA